METTASVSKGCFVFKNGFKLSSSKHKRKSNTRRSLFDQEFTGETWYQTFKNTWENIEEQLETLNYSVYSKVLEDLIVYIKGCHSDHSSMFYNETIPSATLLTGINQPDHMIQFTTLKDKLKLEVTSHVAVVYSQDCVSLKHMIENMVLQFIQDGSSDDSSSDDDDIETRNKSPIVKKSERNMNVLHAWYNERYKSDVLPKSLSPSKKFRKNQHTHHLVVIIPDFERFNCETLQDFILILSGYTPALPFVLVFGVATSVSALHKSFPYQISSKLHVRVFQSQSSSLYLNQVLENIFLTENCPFHLSGKTFKLLIDVFLFYDFSVTGFIQGVKYCMMEHYFSSPIKSLCCPKRLLEPTINQLSDKDLDDLRHLLSFRPYVESKAPSARIALLTNNDYLRIDLLEQLNIFHEYLYNFHTILNVLLGIVSNLPNAPLGKQIRELYATCVSSPIIDHTDFKQCMLIVSFQSKEELVKVLKKILMFITDAEQITNDHQVFSPTKMKLPSTPSKKKSKPKHASEMNRIRDNLSSYIERIENASLDFNNVNSDDEDMTLDVTEKLSRQHLKEKLLKASSKDKSSSEFDLIRTELIKYLTEIFETNLKPPHMLVYHELFFFGDIYKVKKHIVGSPRASIHTALNNPSAYLQCKCCELSNHGSIVPTLPDISIVYKLHLECGKLINLYDWLQAFLTIVDPVDDGDDEEERTEIDSEIQARFTRAVSELQFLGFIKSSKRKTDHVTRLTW